MSDSVTHGLQHQTSLSFTISQNFLILMHRASHTIQSSHPLSPPTPPAFSLSQHQGLSHVMLFASDGQSIGTSASVSVFPMNIQGWFPLGLTDLILQFMGLHHNSKASIFWCSALLDGPTVTSIHDYWKNHSFDQMDLCPFVGKVMSLLLNMLSRFCHSFPSKEQASFNFMVAVNVCSDFGAQENKICHCFHFFPSYLP